MLAIPLHTHPRRLFTGLYLYAILAFLAALLTLIPFLLLLLERFLPVSPSYFSTARSIAYLLLDFLGPVAAILVARGLHPSVRGGAGQPLFRTSYLLAASLLVISRIFLRGWTYSTPYSTRGGLVYLLSALEIGFPSLCDLLAEALTLWTLASLARHAASPRLAAATPRFAFALLALITLLALASDLFFWCIINLQDSNGTKNQHTSITPFACVS